MIGETILHYKILSKLGEGGMGVVYLAEDLKLERKVAVKFLPGHISNNSKERERFKIEAKSAASLNHPNIATIYAIEEYEEQIFIVMEFIEGKELKDIIYPPLSPPSNGGNETGLKIKDLINYAIQIAEGLEAAHKKGIVHRDIKSSNIMITEDGKVKIMDFGLAKIKGGSQLTKAGHTVGTVAYMSPEQSRGIEADQRTDIWSFGVVLFEMLMKKLPFKGDYDQAIIYSILNEKPEFAEEIDSGIRQIIIKSLSKNPDERFKSAGEIAEKLYKINEGKIIKGAIIHSKQLWVIASSVVVLSIFVFLFFVLSKKNIKGKDEINTIAVLPFVNMSPDAGQEYFSEGLSEELINILSKNPKLHVTARMSSFYFKGKQVNIKTIAKTLNVKNILEGSVQKSGNKLRIAADLVNSETDATLWSDTYDGTIGNIFALQDSISGSVAEALNAAILGRDSSASEQKTDPEAYNNYLLGNHFWDLHGKKNFRKAEGYYRKALSIDSVYAQAWLGLSNVHISQADYGYIPFDEGYSEAQKELEKSLVLDPDLVNAYVSIGYIKQAYNWDWRSANESYKRALGLEPENASAISGAARLAFTRGRFNKAIKLIHHSIKINPVDAKEYYDLAFYTWYSGLISVSIGAYKRCLELNPQFPNAYVRMGLDYLAKGDLDSALIAVKMEKEPDGSIYGPALVYYKMGRKKEADYKLSVYINLYHEADAYQIAEIYAYRNEKDKAFQWLTRAYNQHDPGLTDLIGDPLLKTIVKDPRYTALLKKMKLPL